ncbi:hypothetical protein Q5752_006129 [Cryptotrichosporon argae]
MGYSVSFGGLWAYQTHRASWLLMLAGGMLGFNLAVSSDGALVEIEGAITPKQEFAAFVELFKDWRLLALLPLFSSSDYFYACQHLKGMLRQLAVQLAKSVEGRFGAPTDERATPKPTAAATAARWGTEFGQAASALEAWKDAVEGTEGKLWSLAAAYNVVCEYIDSFRASQSEASVVSKLAGYTASPRLNADIEALRQAYDDASERVLPLIRSTSQNLLELSENIEQHAAERLTNVAASVDAYTAGEH